MISAKRLRGQRRLISFAATEPDLATQEPPCSRPSRSPFAVLTSIALAVSALAAVNASAATPDAPWSATGTGSTVATSNGTTADPVLDYSVAGSSGTWTLSATAKSARQQSVNWHYKGYHAWFQVRVKIEKFVVRAGTEILAETLAGAGPVNCCVAPSGGFDYTGTTTFELQTGDVYGFRMSGSHFDRDRRLVGTLSLTVQQPASGLDLETLIKITQERINARDAQIQQLTAELAAANGARDTPKAAQLSTQIQALAEQNQKDLEMISNLLKKLDTIIKNIQP